MTTQETKLQLFKQAIENSNVAKRKNAGVELVDGKIFYYITKQTSSGREYKSKQTYRDMLFMFQKEDINKIINL